MRFETILGIQLFIFAFICFVAGAVLKLRERSAREQRWWNGERHTTIVADYDPVKGRLWKRVG